MVTVWRERGFRIVIYKDDHEPAHVHVVGAGEAKINLMGIGNVPELVWTKGMKRGDVRGAMMIVTEQRLVLLQRWRALHG